MSTVGWTSDPDNIRRYTSCYCIVMSATVKCSFIFCMTCVTYVTREREISRFSFLIFLDSATGGHHTNR